MQSKRIHWARANSPFSACHVAWTRDGVCALALNDNDGAFSGRLTTNGNKVTRAEKCPSEIANQLCEYFEGSRQKFSLALDFVIGTEFQHEVWRKLTEIPYGATRSYKWLAEAAGRPRAPRAVGQANGRNPIPVIVPCHRVVSSDGTLGGYSGGPDVKRKLLALEGVSL